MAKKSGRISKSKPRQTRKRKNSDRTSRSSKRSRLEANDGSNLVGDAADEDDDVVVAVLQGRGGAHGPPEPSTSTTTTKVAIDKSGIVYPRWQFDPFGLDNTRSTDSLPPREEPAPFNFDDDDVNVLAANEGDSLQSSTSRSQGPQLEFEPQLPEFPAKTAKGSMRSTESAGVASNIKTTAGQATMMANEPQSKATGVNSRAVRGRMSTLMSPKASDVPRGSTSGRPSSSLVSVNTKPIYASVNTSQDTTLATSIGGSACPEPPKRLRERISTPTPARTALGLRGRPGLDQNTYTKPAPPRSTPNPAAGQQKIAPKAPGFGDTANTPFPSVTNTPSRPADSAPSRSAEWTPLTPNTTPGRDTTKSTSSRQQSTPLDVLALDGQNFESDDSIIDLWRVLERLISEWAESMVVPSVSAAQAAQPTELPFSTMLELVDRDLASAMWQSPAHAKYLFQIYMWNYLDKVWFSYLSTAWACEPLNPLAAVKSITAGLAAAVTHLTIDNLGTVDTFNREMNPVDRMAFFIWRKNTVNLITTKIVPPATFQEVVNQDVRNIVLAHQGLLRPHLADTDGWRRLIDRCTEIVAKAVNLAVLMRRSDGVWRPFIPRSNRITERNYVALHDDAAKVLPRGEERPHISDTSLVSVTVVPGLAKIRMMSRDGRITFTPQMETVTRRKAKVLVGLTAEGVSGQVGTGVGPVILPKEVSDPIAVGVDL